MMFMPNSPSPPIGTTCSFRSDIVGFYLILNFGCWMRVSHSPTSNMRGCLLLLLVDGPERVRPREAGRNRGGARVTSRMAVAAGADLLAGSPVHKDVVDHVVVPGGGDPRERYSRRHSVGDVIQIQKVAHLPGNDVIRAGGVAADSKSAHQPLDG